MNWLSTLIAFLGPALLPLAAALLLEELTYGGLVRLLLAPRPANQKQRSPEPKQGGRKCLP
jgi:hypothetical protein